MINLELNEEATGFAVAVALPFVLLGSFMWLMASLSDNPIASAELYGYADPMYHYLGLPLTHIIYVFKAEGTLETNDNWWALPMVDALFIAQWIIWVQLAVLVGRVVKRIRIRTASEATDGPYLRVFRVIRGSYFHNLNKTIHELHETHEGRAHRSLRSPF